MAQKSPGGTVITNQIGVVLLTTILLFFAIAFAGEALEEYRLHRELERVNQEFDRLQGVGTALAVTASYMQSSAYGEMELKKAGWKRPNETGVIPRATVVTPVPTTQPTLAPASGGDDPARGGETGPPYWDEWLDLLLGK